MASIEETSGRLEIMGVNAFKELETSIATPSFIAGIAAATARIVFVGDGAAQLKLAGASRSTDEMGVKWAEAAEGFMVRGIREHRLSRSMTRLRILNPALSEMQILEWMETREEVFAQNPGYHGSRFGPEYAQAVASGRVKYDPLEGGYVSLLSAL